VSVPLWLFFISMSFAFCLGWSLGSAIGRARVHEEAREIALLEVELLEAMKLRPQEEKASGTAQTLGRAG
jgi:hypothetical protein